MNASYQYQTKQLHYILYSSMKEAVEEEVAAKEVVAKEDQAASHVLSQEEAEGEEWEEKKGRATTQQR